MPHLPGIGHVRKQLVSSWAQGGVSTRGVPSWVHWTVLGEKDKALGPWYLHTILFSLLWDLVPLDYKFTQKKIEKNSPIVTH